RLTARQGLPGQLGTVGGVVAGSTPTSVSVAGATAGSASASARAADTAVMMRFITAIEHEMRTDVAPWPVSLGPSEILRRGGDLLGVARRGRPRQAQRIVFVARNHVHVEVKDGLPSGRAARVDEVDPVRPPARARAPDQPCTCARARA